MFRKISTCLGLLIATSFGMTGCSTLESVGTSSHSNSPDSAEANLNNDDLSSENSTTERDSQALKSAECLIGDWIVTETELQKFYDTVNVSQATFSISGDMGLMFKEDTYQFLPDFALTLEISGLDAVGEIIGDVRGSYTADDNTLTTSYEDSHEVEFIITVMGQEFDGKELNDTFLAMFAINESPYECENDTLTLGYQNVDGEAVVPVEFTRK